MVSGAIALVPAYDQSRVAYALATRLAREADLMVEPDLPSTAFGPSSGVLPEVAHLHTDAEAGCENLPCSLPKTWSLDSVRAREASALPIPA